MRVVSATVVVLTKLPGYLQVKTRLVPTLGEDGARRLYLEMLGATLALVGPFSRGRPIVAYSPAEAGSWEARAALPGIGPDACTLRPVRGRDAAVCLENALADAFADRGGPLLALGGDAPDLPRGRIEAALEALRSHDGVLVPTPDGGFSCLGLREPAPGLAAAFTYGGTDACSRLRAFFADRGLRAEVLEPWPDVDTPEDLAAYRKRARGAGPDAPA